MHYRRFQTEIHTGAVQNCLEHTIDNPDNVVENTTSAESRIRDTDMAKEMVNYSKNNILAQADDSPCLHRLISLTVRCTHPSVITTTI